MPGLQALLALTTAVLAVRAAAQQVPARFLDDLAPAPRLLLPEARLDALRARHEADPVLRGYVEQVLAAAATEAGREALRYQKRGIRLLAVSRDALQRIQHLAFAYRWTGERRFLDAGRDVLRAACAFPDWNPSHFLDTAELSHAVGLGYDWLRADLDPGEAAAIRDGLVRLGLRPGVAELDKGAWWAESAFNWNNVCFGGLVVGALAVADTDPEWAARLVPAAVRGLPKAIASYDPDGAWMEGPAYWDYATRYTVWGLEAMRSALGSDFGLSDTPGLRTAGHFPIHGAGPTGRYFNYADSGTDAGRGPLPSLFWLAGRFDDAFLAEAEHALLRGGARPAPAHLWFYRPPGGAATAAALDRRFDGRVPVVTMRSAWDDPAALYLAVKGGDNTVNHGQLDCGSFVFDALGQRWAHDLGADDYDLPGYFDKRDGGRRWRYYRNRAASHNVPLLGDEAGRDVEQRVAGTAGVIAHASRPREASCVLDLSEVYGAPVERLRRGVQLRDGRSRVLVQDEWRLAEPRPLAFGLTTRAEVELGDGRRATLRLGGRALRAEVLEPERASFVVEDCPTGAGERSNAGFRRLLLRVPAGRRSVRIAVLLTPVVDGAEAGGLPRIEPLAHW